MNKTLNIAYILVFLSAIIGSLGNTQAMMRGPSSNDPVAPIDYRSAFDQTVIHEQDRKLMEKLVCDGNVFKKEDQEQEIEEPSSYTSFFTKIYSSLFKRKYDPIIDGDPANYIQMPEWHAYKKNCLEKLKKARRWAITEKARESVSTLGLVVGATGIAAWQLDEDSYGQGFIIFAGLFNSVFFLREIIGDCFNLAFTPSHPLDKLERQFAQNQCFIPKDLWPSLVNNFMMARQNPFAQQKSLDLIRFTLGLTTYRPEPKLEYISEENQNITLKEACDILSTKMDTFFEDYTDIKWEDFEDDKKIVFSSIKSEIHNSSANSFPNRYNPLKKYDTPELLALMHKADKGDAESCFKLGLSMYEDEEEAVGDMERIQIGICYLQKAAGQKHEGAIEYLKLLEKDFKRQTIEAEEQYYKLKFNIMKFTASLSGKKKLSRYIHLYGPGGIGKTYFIDKLC